MLVEDYMRRFPVKTKDWFCAKGLIIKDINNPDSGYFTELDYTVFTPQKIFAFECKSYGGDKRSQISAPLEKRKVDPLMSTHNMRDMQLCYLSSCVRLENRNALISSGLSADTV
ncbi:MAG: nuclease-related domain-containing protein [Blautia sp.]